MVKKILKKKKNLSNGWESWAWIALGCLGWAFLEPKHDYRFSTTDNSTLGLGRDWAQLSNSSAWVNLYISCPPFCFEDL